MFQDGSDRIDSNSECTSVESHQLYLTISHRYRLKVKWPRTPSFAINRTWITHFLQYKSTKGSRFNRRIATPTHSVRTQYRSRNDTKQEGCATYSPTLQFTLKLCIRRRYVLSLDARNDSCPTSGLCRQWAPTVCGWQHCLFSASTAFPHRPEVAMLLVVNEGTSWTIWLCRKWNYL